MILTDNQKPQVYFLLTILMGTLILSFFIFRPFLYALILAMIFAIVFRPLHQKILYFTRQKQGLAAFFTTITIVAFILAPLVFLGLQIFQEASQLYSYFIDGGGKNGILNIFNGLMDNFQKLFPWPQEFSLNIDQYLKQGLSWLLQNLGAVFSNFTKLLVSAFIFLIALYYLLKDGQKLKKTVIALSPLTDIDNETIFKKIEVAVNSVIKGNITIALIQGVLTTIGFVIFGVPNPFLWGTVAAIAALIPGIGTALVLTPAIIFLFLTSSTLSGFGLLIWGVIAVGLVDNFLGPKLVERGVRLHSFLILLSVLGGMIFFGPIGFLLGPLTLSLLFALLDIYPSIAKIK